MRALRNKRKIAGELVGKYSNYSAVIQSVVDLNLFSGYLHHCNQKSKGPNTKKWKKSSQKSAQEKKFFFGRSKKYSKKCSKLKVLEKALKKALKYIICSKN